MKGCNMCKDAPLIPDEYREVLPAKSWRAIEYRLARMPEHLRPDALQEAVVAHLEGRSPAAAVVDVARIETLHNRREVPHSQLSPRNA